MKTWIRRGLIAVAALLLLLAALVWAGVQLAQHKRDRRVEVAVQAVPVPSDAATIERGRYLYGSRGCADCHGASGTGRIFIDDGKGLKAAGSNITRGSGSVTLAYQPVDWVRTLRHGVKPDGRPVFIMPSEDYNRLTDADVGAIVAYAQSLPPGAGTGAVFQLPLPVRVLYGFGAIKDAAAKIDHALPPQQPVPEGVTVEHGRYVANMCLGCHGPKLEGGKIPGGPPDWPPAARLTPGDGSVMASRYPDADAFVKMLRTGQRPDGSGIAVMPFEALSKLSDTDARALHLYLKSLSNNG
jgi:mono/diheme cytochrome c family protein